MQYNKFVLTNLFLSLFLSCTLNLGDDEKKIKAQYEEQERQLQQELYMTKEEALQHAELRRTQKPIRLHKFLLVTGDLRDNAKRAQDEAYGIIGKLEDLEKGITNKDNGSIKNDLEKYILN
ncbi:hypothetical protein DB313_05410 (plasmid) [Borrelia turcica IST7]|uniref:Uncharacterized protein n=1 Tax=Borrelia turcica IST7 TaxID=1104446 RepID=A0A386PNX8_9SPIR|nr:hypothetical protein [Borrelia turcica]AYE36938.1 hypothetical protein DB313_05410 [Borrelia turcica IST7]